MENVIKQFYPLFILFLLTNYSCTSNEQLYTESIVDAINRMSRCSQNIKQICADSLFVTTISNPYSQKEFSYIKDCLLRNNYQNSDNYSLQKYNIPLELIYADGYQVIEDFKYTDSFIPPDINNLKSTFIVTQEILADGDLLIFKLTKINSRKNIISELFIYKKFDQDYTFHERICGSNPF